MSDLKLFSTDDGKVTELDGAAVGLERALQNLFERNLETLLGVRFLASEFITSNGGRMDTLGIDENGCPAIIEYKRDRSENVINQGLFYLDWLMDHRGDFELLVRDQCGKAEADKIEWSAPRLICIASDFTRYDEHAVKQMSRNIELIRYRQFGDGLLLLDLLTAASADERKLPTGSGGATQPSRYTTVSEHLENAGSALTDLYADVRSFLIELGDDVQEKTLRLYIAFKRIKNFACVEVKPRNGVILAYLKVDPDTVELESGFTRDVRQVGHFGTGDLEVTISDLASFERAKPLILISYENS